METIRKQEVKTKPVQICVPMTDNEHERLKRYLLKSGMKKGYFTRKALQLYLDEQESSK